MPLLTAIITGPARDAGPPQPTSLPQLPDLQKFSDFLLPNPNPTGPVINAPPISVGGPFPSVTIGGGGSGTPTVRPSSFLQDVFGLPSLGDLKRVLFFILGLIAIIGAIYLYKDTRAYIKGGIRTARRAVESAAIAAE